MIQPFRLHPRPTPRAVEYAVCIRRECAERIFERPYVYARLLELRIRALCSSSGKTSVGRQWEELSNADICSNVPRAVTERRGGYIVGFLFRSVLCLYREIVRFFRIIKIYTISKTNQIFSMFSDVKIFYK